MNALPDYYVRSHFGIQDEIGETVPADLMADYVRTCGDPASVHAVCEVFRAGVGIDSRILEANRRAGRKITQPLLTVWGSKGAIGQSLDVSGLWREEAANVSGSGLACGHLIHEEDPAGLLKLLADFLAAGRLPPGREWLGFSDGLASESGEFVMSARRSRLGRRTSSGRLAARSAPVVGVIAVGRTVGLPRLVGSVAEPKFLRPRISNGPATGLLTQRRQPVLLDDLLRCWYRLHWDKAARLRLELRRCRNPYSRNGPSRFWFPVSNWRRPFLEADPVRLSDDGVLGHL